MAGGQPEAAQRWAEEHASLVENETPDEPQVTRQLALARVWIATGELSRHCPLLRAIEPFIQSAGRVSSRMEIPALRALAQADPDRALADVCQALILGEPQGFAACFSIWASPCAACWLHSRRGPAPDRPVYPRRLMCNLCWMPSHHWNRDRHLTPQTLPRRWSNGSRSVS